MRPKAPPPGFAKIHVDASALLDQGWGAAADVCRDAGGRYLGSSALVVPGVTNVATLGAIARREALPLAKDLSLQNFVVASDSKQVVKDIERDTYSTYRCIIKEIKHQAAFSNCKFNYECRGANKDAYNLAKFMNSLD